MLRHASKISNIIIIFSFKFVCTNHFSILSSRPLNYSMLTQTIFIQNSRPWNYSVLTFCKLHIAYLKQRKWLEIVLICIFRLNTCTWDFNHKEISKVRVLKLKISNFSNVQNELLCSKSSNHDKIQTWPAYSYDVSICHIWVECVQMLGR
jgi:hypothetical protein